MTTPNTAGIDWLRNHIETALNLWPASGQLRVLAVPTDADTLVIGDGTNSAITYTFLDTGNLLGDPNEIEIGTGGTAVADTVANMLEAINVNAPTPGTRGIVALDDGDDIGISLVNTQPGRDGDVAITCDANGTTEITVRGMSSRVQIESALPNADALTIHLGRECHRLKVAVDAGGSCRVSFGSIASATAGVFLDDTEICEESLPHGCTFVSVYCAGDMSGHVVKITGE